MIIRLVLLVGISGSGKSTIAKKLKTIYDRVDGQPCVIVSSDEIRAQLLADASDQSANNKVFGRVHKIINNNLFTERFRSKEFSSYFYFGRALCTMR